MKPGEFEIKVAGADDCEGMATACSRSLLTAYRGVIPDGVFDPEMISPERLAAEITAGMADFGPDDRLFAAESDLGIVGYSYARPYPTEFGLGAGQIKSLYVDPDWWGRGVGTALSQAALDFIASRGHQLAVLHVLKMNVAGRQFYEQRGWTYDCELLPMEIGMHVRYRWQQTARAEAAE